mmetsp:Transcript_56947/g.90213  ORF Transcript_56947/g.90213 Transcript_56947/m.90213 type:complete len:218 (-) Transcript_56947:1071-1724(-)
MFQSPVKFVLELTAPNALTPGAIALWIPRLDHEALNHPVEDDIVVVAILGVHCEVLNTLWTLLMEELDNNVTHGGMNSCLLSQGILSPDGGCHCSIFLAGLLVEDISSQIGCGLWRLASTEEVEPVLFVGRDDGNGICRLLLVIFALNHRLSQAGLLLHRLPLIQRDAQEALGLFHLAQDLHKLVGMEIHNLHTNQRGENQKVPRLVKDRLLVHHSR